MWSFYGLCMRIFGMVMALLGLFNPKAKEWVYGRKKQIIGNHKDSIWIHCASLGEYLQVKPLLKKLEDDKREIVISFYSPSGFNHVSDQIKKYYLPLDTYSRAKEFISSLNPSLAIFVRSEFWFNHLRVLNENSIPTVIMNNFFLPNHYFFKPYGKWFLVQIKKIDFFYTIDRTTKLLLEENGIDSSFHTGDTKVDQVALLKNTQLPSSILNSPKKIIIAGSVEKEDRHVVKKLIEKYSEEFTIIIVPHDTRSDCYTYYNSLSSSITKYSDGEYSNLGIIYVDTHGILSSFYSIAWVAYIGGGFGNGIHNILEASVQQCPVVIGPKHHKFPEAAKLIQSNAAIEIQRPIDIVDAIDYFSTESNYKIAKSSCEQYITENQGATDKLYKHLKSTGLI